MSNGKSNPEGETGITIASIFSISIIKAAPPIVLLERSTGEEKNGGEAGERPQSCEGHHYLGKNAISSFTKESKITDEDSKLD